MNYAHGKKISKEKRRRTAAIFEFGVSKVGRTRIRGAEKLEIPAFQAIVLTGQVDGKTETAARPDDGLHRVPGAATEVS